VLVSVNPYKNIPIYGDEVLREYVGTNRMEMPPHIFSLAEESYRAMVTDQEDQVTI
jgi:myosin heavy subunit